MTNTDKQIPFRVVDWAGIEKTNHPGEKGMAYWRTLQLPGLRVRVVEYSPGFIADHWCRKGHIIYCIKGSFKTEMLSGEVFEIREGMGYIVSDHLSEHRSTTESGVTLFIVDGEFLAIK